ncbi:MAG: hypothetical protein ABIS84_09330 [Arachnia sp.]
MVTTLPPEGIRPPPRGGSTDDGMVVLSYILAGQILYGGLGWLGDHYLHAGWMLPVGLILGFATSTYLIIKRYGRLE